MIQWTIMQKEKWMCYAILSRIQYEYIVVLLKINLLTCLLSLSQFIIIIIIIIFMVLVMMVFPNKLALSVLCK